MSSMAASVYKDAAERGDYDVYHGNLVGKYDNVRVFWEDQLTRFVMRRFLSRMVRQRRKARKKVRILDLGCGTGQGYEILTRIDTRDLDLGLHRDRVLPEKDIELYLGIDLSGPMVERGREIYENKSNVQFVQGDLRSGLGEIYESEEPFDLYFSSYGSFSHLRKDDLESLLVEVCNHGRDGSLIVLDLIGRNSIEWPCYWKAETEAEKYRDYSMSYLTTEFGWDGEVERFPIRFWTGAEIPRFVTQVRAESGVSLEVLKTFDRSIMVGRHVDTAEYNPRLKPIRRMVNRLHEDYMRTDLGELMLEKGQIPIHPDPDVASFIKELMMSWNVLVKFCQQRLKQGRSLMDLNGWAGFSTPLQFALMTLDRVINSTGWLWHGDPRANIIEPQLGYGLRSLEAGLQKGLGCGHGMLVVLKIRKKR